MPALDATRERVSQNRSRRVGRQQAFANSRDRAFSVCIRNFVEYALRCRRDIAWLSRAREHDFFRWVSQMAAFGGHGVCLLLSCLVALTAGQVLFGRLS